MPTTGSHEQGMDPSYKESRGHAPSLVTLAQSGAVLPGNAPSHQDAAEWIDNAIDLGRAARAAGVHTRGHRFLRSSTCMTRQPNADADKSHDERSPICVSMALLLSSHGPFLTY